MTPLQAVRSAAAELKRGFGVNGVINPDHYPDEVKYLEALDLAKIHVKQHKRQRQLLRRCVKKLREFSILLFNQPGRTVLRRARVTRLLRDIERILK